MACNHNNIVQDKPNRVYKCKDCGEVVGHFWTPERIAAEREAEQRWLGKVDGMVSIGNGLYARTRAESKSSKGRGK